MPDAASIAIGVLLPAIFAGIELLLVARRAPPEDAARARFDSGAPAGAFGVGGGYLIAHAGLMGFPDLPASHRTLPFLDWIFWLVAAAVALSPLLGLAGRGRWLRTATVAFFCVVLDRLLRAEPPRGASGVAGAFAGILAVYALWRSIEALAARRPGPGVPAALLAAATGTAVTCLVNGSAALAQLVGAVCATLGAALVVALLVRTARLPAGAVAVAAVALAGAVHVAVVYDLPLGARFLLAAAFAAPWLREMPGLRVRPRTASSVAVTVALAASLGAAAVAAG